MTTFFQGLRERIFKTIAPFRKPLRYAIHCVPEMPDELQLHILYAIGTPEPWSAALLCPCGCKETIHLSLLPSDSPSWRLHVGARNKPTLEPSVWRKHGCHSHFFLRKGQIIWFRQT
jgi:hypothetical protein